MTQCIICNNASIIRVIELGFHPLADTFLKKEQLSKLQKVYPLNCLLCKTCGHLQNEYFVSANERYIESNYSYTSSNSKSARDHWQEFAGTICKYSGLKKGDHVIEFGSNDGYLLKQFIKHGFVVSGIDPAPITVSLARKIGVKTITGFINQQTIKRAIKQDGKAKVIIGNNVLNHIVDLDDCIKAIRSGLRPDGIFIAEVPYLEDVIGKYLFDMIFHEHISTFSIKSIDHLFKKHGLYITRIENIPYHGGSLRIYASLNSKLYSKSIKKLINSENKSQMFNPTTYQDFMSKIIKDKNDCLAQIYNLKSKGKKIAAVGAGARSNTLLNFYKLDSTVIEFVTDASRHKIGKFTPLNNIQIKNDASLKHSEIDVALITAWNIGKYLTDKIRKENSNIRFIVPGKKELI